MSRVWSSRSCAEYKEAEAALQKKMVQINKLLNKYDLSYLSMFILDGFIDFRAQIKSSDSKFVVDCHSSSSNKEDEDEQINRK